MGLIGPIGAISPIRPMSPISLIRSHLRESLARSFDRSFDEFVGVRGRDEGGFELRRGEVYALVQHGVEETGEGFAVAAIGRGPIAHRLRGEEGREHGAYAVADGRDTGL